jgi:hypothetical protein
MYNGYKFIDSDAHILEPPDLWERYLEPRFRGEMPRSYVDYKEDPLGFGIQVVVGDSTMPFNKAFSESRILLPGLGDAYEDYARRGFPPQMYKQAMEQVGMDYNGRLPHGRPVRHGRTPARCRYGCRLSASL